MFQSTIQLTGKSQKLSLTAALTVIALAGLPSLTLAKVPNDNVCLNANSQQIKDKCAGAMPTDARSIPEPAPLSLLGVGVVALWGLRRLTPHN